MCRAGGRRCPSHLSGLARKARNAQRRFEYSNKRLSQLDDLAEDALQKDDNELAYQIMDQIQVLQEKQEDDLQEANSLRQQYVESIAENALISDEQEAAAGSQQPHGEEPLDQDVVKQKQAFSKNYGYVTSDIDELVEGIEDEEDEEELQKLSEIILRTSDRMSTEEVEAAAQYLKQKGAQGAVAKNLHEELAEKAAVSRQEKSHSITDEDIDSMLSEDADAGDSELKNSIAALPPVFGERKYKNKTGKDLFRDTEEVTDTNPDLGIYKTKNTGKLADIRYFNPETIRGKIVKSELNEDSAHNDFGFRKIEPNTLYKMESFNDFKDDEEYAEASRGDLSAATPDEWSSLGRFTGGSYGPINKPLYEGKSPDPLYRNHVKNIDAAMEKGPKRQRYLYRGMKASSSVMDDYETAEQWAEDKFKMGEDVIFDGYQSSSAHNTGPRGFTSGNGVLFEILTPEGVNITAPSLFEQECETLLPRGARYKVVGFQKGVDIKFPGDAPAYTKSNNTVVRLVAVNSKGEILDGSNADKVPPVKKGKKS